MECCRFSFCFIGPFSDAEQTKSFYVDRRNGIIKEMQKKQERQVPVVGERLSIVEIVIFPHFFSLSHSLFLVMHEENDRTYGFVRFRDQNDQRDSLIHMNGFRGLGNKPIRVID